MLDALSTRFARLLLLLSSALCLLSCGDPPPDDSTFVRDGDVPYFNDASLGNDPSLVCDDPAKAAKSGLASLVESDLVSLAVDDVEVCHMNAVNACGACGEAESGLAQLLAELERTGAFAEGVEVARPDDCSAEEGTLACAFRDALVIQYRTPIITFDPNGLLPLTISQATTNDCDGGGGRCFTLDARSADRMCERPNVQLFTSEVEGLLMTEPDLVAPRAFPIFIPMPSEGPSADDLASGGRRQIWVDAQPNVRLDLFFPTVEFTFDMSSRDGCGKLTGYINRCEFLRLGSDLAMTEPFLVETPPGRGVSLCETLDDGTPAPAQYVQATLSVSLMDASIALPVASP